MTEPTAPTGAPPKSTTVVVSVRTRVVTRGRKRLGVRAPDPDGTTPPPVVPVGRTPRVARMLALAHRWRALIDNGVVADQADLARLVAVSRARVTQVMDLLRLAPDVQGAILDLPRVEQGRDPIHGRDLSRLAAEPLWAEQRRIWDTIHST